MYDNPGKCISLKASAAIESKYIAVKMQGNQIVPATGDSDVVIGFVQREGIASEALPVMVNGVSMAVAGGAITAGSPVCAATGGKIVTATGNFCGVALEEASAANDVIPVLIISGVLSGSNPASD